MNPTKSVTEVNGFLDRTSRKEDEGSKQLDELAELGHSLSQSLTLPTPKNLEKNRTSAEGGAQSGALDPYLTRLIELWPQLTDRQRRRLLRLAERIVSLS
jgi:hypothetical protein